MSSTTSTPSSFLSSPRSQRIMMWISGAVLAIGIAVFLGIYFGGSSQDVHTSPPKVSVSQGPVDRNPVSIANAKVPASPAALSVARLFLETAVARKNMATAYTLVGPWLKGVPRAQWIKGNNPVQPFPQAKNLKTAPFQVLSSTKNALYLEVGPLVPMKPTKALRPLSFKLEVDRIHGKWLVNYFIPDYSLRRLATVGAGTGGN